MHDNNIAINSKLKSQAFETITTATVYHLPFNIMITIQRQQNTQTMYVSECCSNPASTLFVDFPSQPRRKSWEGSSYPEPSAPQEQHNRRKRRVSFAATNSYCSISISNEDTWYSKNEYREFKETRKQDVSSVIRQINITSHSSNTDGLPELSDLSQVIGIENYLSKEISTIVKSRRYAHINAVLDEQERQDRLILSRFDSIEEGNTDKGKTDDCNMILVDANVNVNLISEVSQSHSRWAERRAIIIAQLAYELD